MSQAARIKPMVEGGILSAIAVIFALISAYVPFVGPFVNMIWPVPLILLGVRHGFKWSIMATVVAGLISAMLMHPLQAVGVVVGFGLIGIVLGHTFRLGFSPAKAMVWGTAASLISKAAVLAIGSAILGVNPLNVQTETMGKALEQAMGIYRSLGMKEQDLQNTAETMRQLLDMMKIILPAGFAIASVLDTFLNYLVAKAVLKKLGHHIEPFPPFKLWNMPRYTVYIWAGSLVMLYYGQIKSLTFLTNTGMNIQMIASVAMLVQGLALFYFLADKYNLSKLIRNIILVLIFSNGLFTQMLIFAGAFDMALDYRKLRITRTF